MARSPCPDCGSKQLFQAAKAISAGGGYAPNYLPGLGSFWMAGRFEVVVCSDCGLTRFYAERDSLVQLTDSAKWQRI
jgi:predicted nucleic-acid-binding Zn-ribbon protein